MDLFAFCSVLRCFFSLGLGLILVWETAYKFQCPRVTNSHKISV